MSEELDDFSFDHDTHTYTNAAGEIRPSVTETLKHGGIFSYWRIPPDVIERKRIIGQNVHDWCARHDLSNREYDDLLDLYEEERPYAESHLRWRDAMGAGMEILAVEQKMLRPILGLEMGGTLDLKVRIENRIWIIDRKCVDTFHVGWRIQTADYVMLDTGRTNCSAYRRGIVRLRRSGRPAWDPISPDHDQVDSVVAAAMLQTYVWRRNHRLL